MNLHLLLFDTTNFWVANWYYVVAVTIALIGLFFTIRNSLKKSKSRETSSIQNNPTNTNAVTFNFGNLEPVADTSVLPEDEALEGYDKQKKLTNILFIDDDTKFKIVKILIQSGWINTKSIIDLNTYDDSNLIKSHIVFVDVQGVGKNLHCKDEGLSLAMNIKNKYPEKKVVLYSAIQTQNIFHEAIKKVDFLLSKDAEPYEFITLIEKYSREIIK